MAEKISHSYQFGDVWHRPEAVLQSLDLPLAHQALEQSHEADELQLTGLGDGPRPLLRHAPHGLTPVQGDHSACGEPPVDFKTKVPLWPG